MSIKPSRFENPGSGVGWVLQQDMTWKRDPAFDVDGTPMHVESNHPYAADKPKITTTNPKDLLGDKKVSLDAVSPYALIEESLAMMDGEWKYGYRNWREKEVRARVYVNACKRHLDMWLEGQERAGDSKVHHLGHARACLGIILDAQATGNLVDDRSKTGDLFETKMERASKWVEWRKQFHLVTALTKRVASGDTQAPLEREAALLKLKSLEDVLNTIDAE